MGDKSLMCSWNNLELWLVRHKVMLVKIPESLGFMLRKVILCRVCGVLPFLHCFFFFHKVLGSACALREVIRMWRFVFQNLCVILIILLLITLFLLYFSADRIWCSCGCCWPPSPFHLHMSSVLFLAGPSGRLQLCWHGQLYQQEGCAEQRCPRLHQLLSAGE